jgi:hypothetical protein
MVPEAADHHASRTPPPAGGGMSSQTDLAAVRRAEVSDWQISAFRETVELAERLGMPEEPGNNLGLEHLRSMLETASNSDFSRGKLGRWLGWAQCAVVAANVGASLDAMKAINMAASKEFDAATVCGGEN